MPLHSLTPLSEHTLLGLWQLTEMPPELLSLLPHFAHYAAQQPAVRDVRLMTSTARTPAGGETTG